MSAYTHEIRQQVFQQLDQVKLAFAARGWFPGTSGNLSIKISSAPLLVAVTASGKDKTVCTPHDYLVVDENSKPYEATTLKPSAETQIHTAIYRNIPEIGAVFHVHTVPNNIVSELYGNQGYVTLRNQELIKGLGIWEEGAEIQIPIVENYANIPRLAKEVERVLNPQVPGVLIRNHGIYAWGKNDFEAKRHLEAFEFLFAYHLQWLQVQHIAVQLAEQHAIQPHNPLTYRTAGQL
ncbi:methylthioribulose 1-phosphate dehydratase [Aneurinibacillus thermoaerophilus]|uniref:Methylthioribulose-1-phosphate dehydratase n=1 Tax=Aneurinibacillus thermoaerophilus TaxID=143495 RepID=A0A1G8A862_ANETH|nr:MULTISPECIES: methylthioribulose 1-phosphate dehydratase [Aneurinibacillus]AMA74070.1 methylthioribulose-1-phosphate dehydratase [Aneurinibacillus sp. XH2]MED0675442.1 methylthioribulose 1-phosphate dehydratase [Aneurinibacillus thermoaerophilus]MED0678796.1 methylthioribulose 1-phosphate dehydratase [Aneurinibacillus thermoaerophilus]MED0758324.1 methylthioribulose 1-phosphate dehydratase [Aneurinibacillus thermoaerophilus]MED0759869.1 methylthioribulose 1-phosphate dehydratase [Aneuriniba